LIIRRQAGSVKPCIRRHLKQSIREFPIGLSLSSFHIPLDFCEQSDPSFHNRPGRDRHSVSSASEEFAPRRCLLPFSLFGMSARETIINLTQQCIQLLIILDRYGVWRTINVMVNVSDLRNSSGRIEVIGFSQFEALHPVK
jgi:hypothetical protein